MVKECLGRFIAPKGLYDLAQGFNPGNHRIRGFALKGREITMCLSGSITRAIGSPFRALRRGDTVPRVETLG
jgi:hypothetical protein